MYSRNDRDTNVFIIKHDDAKHKKRDIFSSYSQTQMIMHLGTFYDNALNPLISIIFNLLADTRGLY